MKKHMEKLVAKCVVSQHVKVEHQRPLGLLQPLCIRKCKWEHISIDLLVYVIKTIYVVSFKVFYLIYTLVLIY